MSTYDIYHKLVVIRDYLRKELISEPVVSRSIFLDLLIETQTILHRDGTYEKQK